MKNNIKFGGVAIDVKDLEDIEKNFDDYHGDRTIFLSKKEYKHEEEGLNFRYKYIIEVIDLKEYTGEEGAVIQLELAISPEDTHEVIYNDMLETFGLEDCEDYEHDYYAVIDYGLGIQMALEEFEKFDKDIIDENLNAVASIVPMIDSFRGFYLDKNWNALGSTGWDTVRHILFNENIFGF